jgi:hypothetical protein
MVMILPNELRSRAEFYRSLSSEGDDVRLKVALLSLAEEFEREADAAEAGMARNEPQRRVPSPRNSATLRVEAATGADIDRAC